MSQLPPAAAPAAAAERTAPPSFDKWGNLPSNLFQLAATMTNKYSEKRLDSYLCAPRAAVLRSRFSEQALFVVQVFNSRGESSGMSGVKPASIKRPNRFYVQRATTVGHVDVVVTHTTVEANVKCVILWRCAAQTGCGGSCAHGDWEEFRQLNTTTLMGPYQTFAFSLPEDETCGKQVELKIDVVPELSPYRKRWEGAAWRSLDRFDVGFIDLTRQREEMHRTAAMLEAQQADAAPPAGLTAEAEARLEDAINVAKAAFANSSSSSSNSNTNSNSNSNAADAITFDFTLSKVASIKLFA